MCGLYGILDKTGRGLDYNDEDLAIDMGIMTQMRGRHSSGIFVVDGKSVNKKPKIVKALGPSNNLEWEKNWEPTMKIVRSTACALIGHGRYATSGKITLQNAHPFHDNGITLVHNGTIRKGLEDEMKEVEVDSHALTKAIASKGMIDALHSIEGAYAIILHNANDGKIYIARNHERTLHFVDAKDRIYIMSAPGALEFLNKQKYIYGYTDNPQAFETGVVYVYDPEEGEMRKETELKKPTVVSYKPPAITPQNIASSWRPSSSTPSTPSGSNQTVDAAHYKKGENVEFVVRAMFLDNSDGLWHYRAVDTEGRNIFFKTPEWNASWNGRTGVGPICALHLGKPKHGSDAWEWSYQVKTRNIVWDDETTEENVETADCIISAKEWKEITATQKCVSCNNALDPNTPEDTYVEKKTSKWVCLCPSCLGYMLDTKQVTKASEAARLLN